MKLGEIIKNYRTEQAISQKAFAEKCGLPNSMIVVIERDFDTHTGKPSSPTLASLRKIAYGLGITIDELIDEMDDTPVSLSKKEIKRMAEVIYTRPGMKALFDKLESSSDEDIKKTFDVISIFMENSKK